MLEYNVVAIIPARSNSKGIQQKNLQRVGGKSLVEITVDAALDSKSIDLVVVSTDSDRIREEVDIEAFVIDRPEELAQDHVQVDEVVLFTLRQLQYSAIHPKTLIVLQPTSPLRTASHIDEALELYHTINELNYKDNPVKHPVPLVSVWEPGWGYEVQLLKSGGYLSSYEWNPSARLGRQEGGDPGIAIENGAIYIADAKLVSRKKTFRFTEVIPYYMDKMSSLEVDEIADLEVAEVYYKYS